MLQSSNAANPGDQLKHGLLAELLSRCLDWPSLTYAETHAGAGIYSAAAQASPRDHIVRLQAKLRSSDETANVGAGAAYARLLSDWWNQPRPSLDYPGSVVQAALLLRQGRTGRAAADIRVTEADPVAQQLLQNATAAIGVTSRCRGFQDEIGWLTETDSLVLLIDPFTYGEAPSCVTRGNIDAGTLLQVLQRCRGKQRCMIGFWCAATHASTRRLRIRVDGEIEAFVLSAGGVKREFSAGNDDRFQMTVIGLGDGVPVVSAIPGVAAWSESWLRNVILEKPTDL
jgi:hypothetical protein